MITKHFKTLLLIGLITHLNCKAAERSFAAAAPDPATMADAVAEKSLIGMWKTISFKVDGKEPSDAKHPPIVFRKDGTCLWGGSTGTKYDWTYDKDTKELELTKTTLFGKTTAISAKVEWVKENMRLKWYMADMNFEMVLAPDK